MTEYTINLIVWAVGSLGIAASLFLLVWFLRMWFLDIEYRHQIEQQKNGD